jgi:hypothetical protein
MLPIKQIFISASNHMVISILNKKAVTLLAACHFDFQFYPAELGIIMLFATAK